MDKFTIISKNNKASSSCSRTVRFNIETYEKLMELSNVSGESFNKIVNQALEFALNNLEVIDESKK